MSLRSPVVSDSTFPLPFTDVVAPTTSASESSSSEEDSSASLGAILASSKKRAGGPVAVLNRFTPLGVPKDRPGIRHTLFFSKRPVGNSFSIQDECKVSGYLSYSYLLCGSVVVGVVFSTDNSKTTNGEYKLVVRGRETSRNFTPNFNLEKMGLLMFVAEDSSALVIPNDVESSLLVRTD